jgi:RNA polymerase sigma factor (sigma-70 family)
VTNDASLRSTDDQLAERFACGDCDAFLQLYERYLDSIYDFTARLVGNRDDAADVTQETFLKALTALRARPPKGGVRPWLFAIARNTAIDWLRRRRTIPLSTLQAPESDERRLSLLETAPETDPELAAELAELAELVWQAARGLNPADYALLDLSLRQALSTDELAQALGTSRGTIHTRLSRLRDALEDSLTVLVLAQRASQDCAQLSVLLAGRALPADLTPALRREIARHVQTCETCQRNRHRYATAAELLPALAPVLPTAEVHEALRAHLVGTLHSTTPGEHSRPDPLTDPAQPTGHLFTRHLVRTTPGKAVLAVTAASLFLVLVALVVHWGTASVRVETVSCPPLELRFGGAAEVLARASGVPAELAPGQPAAVRLPVGTLRASTRPDSADLTIRGFPVHIWIDVDLARVSWDGRDLLRAGEQRLSLERGSAHTLTLVCR